MQKKKWIQPILTGTFFFFCRPLLFDKWKAIQSWQFVFTKLLLPELISKKALSNPWIADNSRKKSAQGWDLHLKFFLVERKWMAAKQNDKQTKTHEDPYTRMNNHEHPWTPMSTWARMSTHELTWIRVFPNTMQLANCLLNRMSHSFWASYFGLLAIYVNFWFNCFFLNWTLILFLCFIFFWFCPAVASRSNCWFLQNMTFNLYKYSYLSFIYLFI